VKPDLCAGFWIQTKSNSRFT